MLTKQMSLVSTRLYQCARLSTHPARHLSTHPASRLSTHPARCLSTHPARRATYSVQTEEEFKTKVMGGSKPVVIDFSATWCGPCRMLTPRLESAVGATNDAVDLAIVDIDDLSDIAIEHDVSAVPTVLAVKNGVVVDRFVGLIDEDKLKSFIDRLQE